MTRFCSKSFFKILNKRAIKHKIWWYHWISRWILSMIKFKNLFLTEKITKLWPFSRGTSILTKWVWGLFLGVYLFMSLRKKLINWLVFQLGKCFNTFSYTEFNEEISGTIRFYPSPQFCWENVQKQIVTGCELWKKILKLNPQYLTFFKVDLEK